MSLFRDIGESIGERAGREAVEQMVSSGRMDRIIEDAVAKTYGEMASDPKYAAIRDRLLAATASIRDKREAAERKARDARLAEYRMLPWWMRWLVHKPT